MVFECFDYPIFIRNQQKITQYLMFSAVHSSDFFAIAISSFAAVFLKNNKKKIFFCIFLIEKMKKKIPDAAAVDENRQTE